MKHQLRKKLIQKESEVKEALTLLDNSTEWSILSSYNGLKITSEYGASLIHSNGTQNALTLAYVIPSKYKADICAHWEDKRLEDASKNIEKLGWSYMSVNSDRAEAFMTMDNLHQIVEYINSEVCTKEDRADFLKDYIKPISKELKHLANSLIKKQSVVGMFKINDSAASIIKQKSNGQLSHIVAFKFSGGWRVFIPTHEHLKSFVKASYQYESIENSPELDFEHFETLTIERSKKVELNRLYA